MEQSPDLGKSAELEPVLAENASLREENRRLAAFVAELEQKLAAALAEIERLKRSGQGGAAPFSRGRPKPNPKKPGRKP